MDRDQDTPVRSHQALAELVAGHASTFALTLFDLADLADIAQQDKLLAAFPMEMWAWLNYKASNGYLRVGDYVRGWESSHLNPRRGIGIGG